MAESLITREKLDNLMDSLGIQEVRSREDFRIFFSSALERYNEMRPTYVARNISFLLDSLFITMSHATNPKKNPHGSGLSLGSLTGLLYKCSDAMVCEALFKNVQARDFFSKCMVLAKKTDNFNLVFFKEYVENMDISKLDNEELIIFNSFMEPFK